jgi:hypothetical protein
MSVYTKFNNKNLNTNFDFVNGLVMRNHTETDKYKHNKDIKGNQTGSGGNGKHGEQKITNPIKDDVYDELFKQATIYTGVKHSNGGGKGTNINTKKRTKLKKEQTKKNKKSI